jgi:hypothetical protein
LLEEDNERLEELRTRQMQILSGVVLKGDHSRKLTKQIKILGTQVFKSTFSIMNEFNQISAFFFTVGEALDEIRPALLKLDLRYVMHGFKRVKLWFTDNCCNERNWLKQVGTPRNLQLPRTLA